MKIALFQMKMTDNPADNLEMCIHAIEDAGNAGADMVLFPELTAYKRLPEHQKQRMLGCSQSDIDPEVVRFLANSAEPKAVVTVIETKGSTPRAAGAKMAVSPLGQVTGSIGGGCSESEVIREAIRIIGTKTYKIVEIDLTGEVAESEGMVCGGIMRVLIEDA